MIIDTHKAIEKLLAVGNTKENSEAIVGIINSQEENLATKGDFKLLEAKIEGEMNSLAKDINWLKAVGFVIIGLLIKIAFFSN